MYGVSKWRRGLAWLIDFSLAIGLAVLLGHLTFQRIVAQLHGSVLSGADGLGAWQVLSSHGRALSGGLPGMVMQIWHGCQHDVEEAFIALTLGVFLYQLLTVRLLGHTLGKALLGLRVSDGGEEGLRLGWRPAAVRAAAASVADVGCYAVACCLLVAGDLTLAVVLWLGAVAALLANAISALQPSGRSISDRLSGSAVRSVRLPESAVQAVQAVASGTREVVANAPQAIAEAEATRRALEFGRSTADSGRKAWESVRQGAQDGTLTPALQERLRQARESELSRVAAERGRVAAERGRVAAERGRATLGRARSRWAQRGTPRPPVPQVFPTQQTFPVPSGYPVSPGYPTPPGHPVPPGYPTPPAYPAPQGFPGPQQGFGPVPVTVPVTDGYAAPAVTGGVVPPPPVPEGSAPEGFGPPPQMGP